MSLQIADNFSYKGKKPLDARLVCNDIPDMLALPTSTIYDGIIVYVVVQKKFYTYDSNNTVDPTLQQWRELTTAGILIQSATIDNVTTSATKGHLILTMSDGTTIDCGDAKGDKGDKGDGFAIIKLYTSVSDMTSDASPVNDGQMVAVIDNTTSPITAKVYIRNSSQTHDSTGNENGYTFFCNLADATVIQGPQGPQGPQGVKGDTPVITTQAIAATSTTPSGTKITFTTGTGSTATSTSINVYNGKDGVSVSSATINASGELVFTLSDASTINVGKIGGNGTGGCITMLGCFDTAPTTFVQDNIYYNNLDGLIYKSPDGTTWGTGTQPEKDILYISMDDHKIYSYTNNTFEVYGGSDTKISKEPFNTLSLKLDGLYAEPKGLGAAYRRDTIIYDNPVLNTVKTNDIIELSDDITNYDSLFICTGSDCNSADTRKIHEIRLNDVDYINDSQYKYGLDFCYNTTYYYSIRFKFIDSKHIKISSVIYGGWSGATIVQIVGTKYTTDVSQLVDSSKGIEDTPVGELITKIGSTKIPAHYLACDGSTHNIADYPELAQCIKDEFGSFNYYGGDGVTTFAVPNYNSFSWWQPTLVKGLIPRPYSVLVSSSFNTTQYQKELMFDGIISKDSCWHSAADGSDTNIWVKFDFGSNTYINGLRMAARPSYLFQLPSTFTIEGSNDDVTYTVIKSYSGLPTPASTAFREHIFDKPVNYRYYKLNHITSNAKNGGYDYCSIAELEFSKVDSMSYIKYEPTYYMELNQDAYVNEYCDYYDTNERIVGRWIDGKPIYQITINCGALPNTRDKEIAHNVSNIDYVINAFGIGINSNNGYSIIIGGTGTNSNHASDVGLHASRSIIKVKAYDDRSAYTGYVTIQYTKTTDAPNSFNYSMIIDQFAQEALIDIAVTDEEVNRCLN